MKKIMFNDRYGLTEAVLSGRKTMTRRIIPNCTGIRQSPFCQSGVEDNHGYELKPKYKVGEIVAIAQSYKDAGYSQYALNRAPKTMEIRGHMGESAGWNNKMFVRAEACKNRIRITNVRVERLQDISDEDCLKEGIIKGRVGSADTHFMDAYYLHNKPLDPYVTPRKAFAALIDKVSGKGTWDSNPFVFAYEFELKK